MTSVELCPKCHASIPLTSYKLGYQNPTQSEVACIESTFGNPHDEMEGLIQKIERVESMLDVLKAHHTHLNTYIQRSTRYIRRSPIRRLPTEVLGIIFASACTSFPRNEYKTPLSISLVCSKWRDMALSTPSLWTHIHIAPHSGGLEHFLERCGNIPISIKVEIPYNEWPRNWPDCNLR
ncbi:hypothetical protein CPB85DRAFT_1332202 [Mucidula mucida]|nr:hypothetical protein CPB85DRAFT_1332202 [Mucidula mucida]